MNNLVTVKTALLPMSLSVAVSYLEENGIRCNLEGDMSRYTGNQSLAELQVAEGDVAEAKRLLIEGEFSTLQDFEELGI